MFIDYYENFEWSKLVWWSSKPRDQLNIKMVSYYYRDSYYDNKTDGRWIPPH